MSKKEFRFSKPENQQKPQPSTVGIGNVDRLSVREMFDEDAINFDELRAFGYNSLGEVLEPEEVDYDDPFNQESLFAQMEEAEPLWDTMEDQYDDRNDGWDVVGVAGWGGGFMEDDW